MGEAASRVSLGRLCWLGFSTFLIQCWRDIVTHYMFTLAPAAVTTMLYCVVFGNFMGGYIGNLEGLTYAQYIAPGIIVLPTIASAYGQAGLALVVAKLYRQIDEQLISPQPSWMIVVNYVSGGILRGMTVGVVAGIITLIFTRLPIAHVLWVIPALLLVSLVASLAGFINGVFAKTLDEISWVTSFVLTPLTYLSGVFFSISMLPVWGQRISRLDPIFYLLDIFRYSMLGVSDGHLSLALLAIFGLTAAMFAVAIVLMTRGYGLRE